MPLGANKKKRVEGGGRGRKPRLGGCRHGGRGKKKERFETGVGTKKCSGKMHA